MLLFQKTECPLCGDLVVNISRHMRSSKHKWTLEESKYTRAKLGIRVRNRNKKSSSPMKSERPFKSCTLCSARVTRLDQHLKRVHSKEQEKERKEKAKTCLLTIYRKWLESPDSGGLTKVTITRCCNILERVFAEETIGSLQNILNENLIRDIWTKKLESREWEKATAGTYLYSLVTFFKYLQTNSFKNSFKEQKLSSIFKMEHSEIKDVASSMRDSTCRWAKAYVNENRPEMDSRYNEQMKNLLKPEEKKIIKKGPLYRTVQKIMKKNPEVSDSSFNRDFLDIRNYVVSNIFARNAHRPGVVYNMTLGEFESARNVSNMYLIDVKRHKTSKQRGCADVTIESEFYQIMKAYSSYRALVLHSKGMDVDQFFITREGTKLDPSNVNSAFQAGLRANGIKRRINAGLVRMSATSSTGKDPDARSAVSCLMMHSESTANQYYRRIDRDAARIRGAMFLNKDSDTSHQAEVQNNQVDEEDMFDDIQPEIENMESFGSSKNQRRGEQKTQLDRESIDQSTTEEPVSGVEETEDEEEISVGYQPEDLEDHGRKDAQEDLESRNKCKETDKWNNSAEQVSEVEDTEDDEMSVGAPPEEDLEDQGYQESQEDHENQRKHAVIDKRNSSRHEDDDEWSPEIDEYETVKNNLNKRRHRNANARYEDDGKYCSYIDTASKKKTKKQVKAKKKLIDISELGLKRDKTFTTAETNLMLQLFHDQLYLGSSIRNKEIVATQQTEAGRALRKYKPMQINTRLRYLKTMISANY